MLEDAFHQFLQLLEADEETLLRFEDQPRVRKVVGGLLVCEAVVVLVAVIVMIVVIAVILVIEVLVAVVDVGVVEVEMMIEVSLVYVAPIEVAEVEMRHVEVPEIEVCVIPVVGVGTVGVNPVDMRGDRVEMRLIGMAGVCVLAVDVDQVVVSLVDMPDVEEALVEVWTLIEMAAIDVTLIEVRPLVEVTVVEMPRIRPAIEVAWARCQIDVAGFRPYIEMRLVEVFGIRREPRRFALRCGSGLWALGIVRLAHGGPDYSNADHCLKRFGGSGRSVEKAITAAPVSGPPLKSGDSTAELAKAVLPQAAFVHQPARANRSPHYASRRAFGRDRRGRPCRDAVAAPDRCRFARRVGIARETSTGHAASCGRVAAPFCRHRASRPSERYGNGRSDLPIPPRRPRWHLRQVRLRASDGRGDPGEIPWARTRG